jgi:hypothetical protein
MRIIPSFADEDEEFGAADFTNKNKHVPIIATLKG